jgi:maltose O-acetyltransferase
VSGIVDTSRPTLRRLRELLEPAVRRALHRVRGEQNVERLVAQGLQLGPRTFIGQGVTIDAGHPWLISIGEDSVLTSGTVVLAHDGSTKIHTGRTRIARTSIGKRVFVGAGAVILAGSTIGDESIVGPLSVVRGEVPPRSLVIGNPAQVVSSVESFAQRHRLAAEQGPAWPHEGWMAGRGITDERKRHQLEALAGGASGYLGS